MAGRWAWLRAGALALLLALAGCGGGGSGGVGLLPAGTDGVGAGAAGPSASGGGSDGPSVAGGVGSGGTGISGEGVGSGGTGATADAASVGSVDGFGSIVVNGVRFDISAARIFLADITELRLGVTVRVSGTIDPSLSAGTATVVVSAADLRGPVAGLDVAGGRFSVLSLQVSTDAGTAYGGGLASVADLRNGDVVQVHGLPGPGAQLRATRIERVSTAGVVLSGAIQSLDARARTFRIGTQQVQYAGAAFDPAAPASSLAEGQVVRVRAAAAAGVLQATAVEPWYPLQAPEGKRLTLSGLVSSFASLRSLRVDGVPVDASSAQITGGSAADVADGAKVEAAGTVSGGVLVATRLTIRHGTASPPPVFSARGSVGSFRSPSDFKVQGQRIDAGQPGVEFVGGTAADLGPSRKVLVTGSRVQNDVLVAERVEFLQ